MAKGIYIGVDDKARKVTKMYIGVDGKARKVKKGYIGVDGKARLFYSLMKEIEFTENIIPISGWSNSSYTSATATNDYGTWQINATSYYGQGYRIQYGFDNYLSKYWMPAYPSTKGTYSYATVYAPEGVLIKPYTINYAQAVYSSDKTSILQGYLPDNIWEDIINLSNTGSTATTLNVNTDKFYKGFRIKYLDYSTSDVAGRLYRFRIPTGALGYELGTIIKNQVFFKVNSFTEGTKTITGQATKAMYDGDMPTMEITTSATNGFTLGGSSYNNYTSIYGEIDNTIKSDIASINSALLRTEENDRYGVIFDGFHAMDGKGYENNQTIIFDFKKPRTLTLNVYMTGDTHNHSWYGSNDKKTWTPIEEDIDFNTAVRPTSNTTPYRYYKWTTPSSIRIDLRVMYFTDVSDTIL